MITKKELGDAIKRLIPEESLSLMDLLKVLTVFDTNRNGLVEESEFISTIQKARDTTISASRGQKPIAGDSTLQNGPSRGSKQVKPDESLALLINGLEEKVSLKSVFSEVTINEDGKY